jgi:hypothetical protein
MINVVFLTDEDDRNITKRLIFSNFENYLFSIYITHEFHAGWNDEMLA